MEYIYDLENGEAVIRGVFITDKTYDEVSGKTGKGYIITVPNVVDGYPVKRVKSLMSNKKRIYFKELRFEDGIEIIDDYGGIGMFPELVRLPKTLKYLGANAGKYWDIHCIILPEGLKVIGEKALGMPKRLINLSDLDITTDMYNMDMVNKEEIHIYNFGNGKVRWSTKSANEKIRNKPKEDYLYQLLVSSVSEDKGSIYLEPSEGNIQYFDEVYYYQSRPSVYQELYDHLEYQEYMDNLKYDKYRNMLYTIEHDGFEIEFFEKPLVFHNIVNTFVGNTALYVEEKYSFKEKDSWLKKFLLKIVQRIK